MPAFKMDFESTHYEERRTREEPEKNQKNQKNQKNRRTEEPEEPLTYVPGMDPAKLVPQGYSPAIGANPHDIIEFPFYVKANVFVAAAPLYKQGLSLSEIATRIGIPKTTVRTELLKNGVSLRPNSSGPKISSWRTRGKKSERPPYGFCYFEGQIVKHPKEYPVLHQIYLRWKSGESLNSIATWLNGKRYPSAMNKCWSWNAVSNVIKRFKNKTVSLEGGNYVLK